MTNSKFTRRLVCPWCQQGEVLADGTAKISVSAQCPRCHKFFVGNLDSLKTERSAACKRLELKK